MKELMKRESLEAQLVESDIQLRIHQKNTIRANEVPKIREMNIDKIRTLAETLLGYLFQDLGLQGKPTEYEVLRFIDFLAAYFSDFSLDEVKLAFEYWIAGELEPFLKAQPKHYGRWSLDFLSTILKAYRSYRGRVITDASRLLPEKEEELSDEKKEEEYLSWLRILYSKLVAAMNEEAAFPPFFYSSSVHKNLVDVGLLQPREVAQKEIDEAVQTILADPEQDHFTKKKVARDRDAGRLSDLVRTKSITNGIKRDIDELIEIADVDLVTQKFKEYVDNRN